MTGEIWVYGDNVALAPGLTALHTPGHTPGHYGLVVSSGEERAVLLGDAVECPLHQSCFDIRSGKVLSPPWAAEIDDWELFGYSLEETRQFAGTCLMRRLKVIGLQ